jgi:2-keto-3-deoxy-L-rhamnonate aldolase RhmA
VVPPDPSAPGALEGLCRDRQRRRHGTMQNGSRDAVGRIAEIAVPGVDSLYLGPMDLSGSIGELDDPEVKALRANAERAILATDAVLGTIETAAGGYDRLAAKGYRLIFATSDVALLRNGPAGLTANKA